MSNEKKGYSSRRNVESALSEPQVNMAHPTARENRADGVSRARRRRQDSGEFDGNAFKLAVPEDEKDQRYVYRWINDDGSRIMQMTKQDDWDICTVDEFSTDFRNTGEGTQVSRIVGKDSTGRPMRAFLCKKLREYEESDRARELERLDRLYFQMRQGELPGNQGFAGENPNLRYVPKEARGY